MPFFAPKSATCVLLREPANLRIATATLHAEDERYHKMDVMIHEMEQGLQAMERSIGSIGHLDPLGLADDRRGCDGCGGEMNESPDQNRSRYES